MPNSNNNNNDPVNAGNVGLVEEGYFYNNEGNNQEFTQEELAAIARNVNERNRANRERQAQAERNMRLGALRERWATRALRGLPGAAPWVARARGRINTRRRAAARENQIRRSSQRARRDYKEHVNNAANLQYGSNENLNSQNRAANFMVENEYDMEKMRVQSLRNAKANLKRQAVNQLRQTLRNSAAAENARIYANTKNVLLSEPRNYRQTVLKIAALDDLMIEEREKLALAATNNAATEAATRLYNIEELKGELDQARHESRLPTAEQNARYAELVAGKNFNSMPTSLYRRLVGNNAAKTAEEVAAAEEAAALAALPMVPVEEAPRPQGKLLGGPNAAAAPALTPAELRALRAARFGKKGGKRTRRHRKN